MTRKDGGHDLQQALCLLEPQSPYLYNGDEQVYYLHPHFTDEETDQSLVAAELTGQGHSAAALLLPVQMRCESSLQTLLPVSRVVATNSTPREAGASMGAALRAPQKTVLCSYSEIQSLKDLRENVIHALGRRHATCRCRN